MRENGAIIGPRRPTVTEQHLRTATWQLQLARALLLQVVRGPRPPELTPAEWDKLRYVTTYVGRGAKVTEQATTRLAYGEQEGASHG